MNVKAITYDVPIHQSFIMDRDIVIMEDTTPSTTEMSHLRQKVIRITLYLFAFTLPSNGDKLNPNHANKKAQQRHFFPLYG